MCNIVKKSNMESSMIKNNMELSLKSLLFFLLFIFLSNFFKFSTPPDEQVAIKYFSSLVASIEIVIGMYRFGLWWLNAKFICQGQFYLQPQQVEAMHPLDLWIFK